MVDQPRRVPDWLLERIALGETPPDQADELARRMAEDPTAQARLEALRASNQEILAALPPAQVAAEVERRRHLAEVAANASATPRRRAWMTPAVAGAMAMAVLALVLLPREQGVAPDIAPVGEERAKGDPHLVIHRKRGDEVERLERNATARAGDLLQIAYVAAGHAHGVIFSIDGAGAVTLHHPRSPAGDTALPGKGAVELDHAYELDDAPDYERFFFVTVRPAPGVSPEASPEAAPEAAPEASIDTSLILDRARALTSDPAAARSAPLDLPGSMQQWSFLLRKERHP